MRADEGPLLPAAEAGIEGIWDDGADNWGPDQAAHHIDAIRDACRALAAGTKRGRVVDVRPNYLKATTGSHVLYYRENGDRIEIIRILHARQDVDRHL